MASEITVKLNKSERKLAKLAKKQLKLLESTQESTATSNELTQEELDRKLRKQLKKQQKLQQSQSNLIEIDTIVTLVVEELSKKKKKEKKRKAIEEIEPIKKKSKSTKEVDQAIETLLESTAAVPTSAPTTSTSTLVKKYVPPPRTKYPSRSSMSLTIPGITTTTTTSTPTTTTTTSTRVQPTQASKIATSLLTADDDDVLAAVQRVGLPLRSPTPPTATTTTSKGKGKEIVLDETAEETKAREKAERKAERKAEKKRLATTSNNLDNLVNDLATFKSTVPIIVRDQVVKRAPAKVVKTKATLTADELNNQDIVDLLGSKWLTHKEMKEIEKARSITFKSGKFSTSEEKIIKEAVEAFQTMHNLTDAQILLFAAAKSGPRATDGLPDSASFWKAIAHALSLRSLRSIYAYVTRAYDPLSNMGEWTTEQDQALLLALKVHGPKWSTISIEVGRARGDCKDRYTEELAFPNKIMGEWTEAEENQLFNIMAEHGKERGTQPWKDIAQIYGGTRTPTQIRSKWTDDLNRRRQVNKAKGTHLWNQGCTARALKFIKKQKVKDISEIDWTKTKDETLKMHGPRKCRNCWNSLVKVVAKKLDEPTPTFKQTLRWGRDQYSDVNSQLGMPKDRSAAATPKKVTVASVGKAQIKSTEFITESDDENDDDQVGKSDAMEVD